MFTPDDIRLATMAIQEAVRLVFVLSGGLCLFIGWRWPETRRYLFLPLTLCAHAIVFYVVVLSVGLTPTVGNLWSAALRLHTGVALFGSLAAVALALRDYRERR